MRNEEFEIVRSLISGRGLPSAPSSGSAHALAPTSFREIDGQELARQYVAYRKLRESEALADEREAGGLPAEAAITGVLRGERRVSGPIDVSGREDSPGNWLSGLARSLWRR